MRSLSLNWIPKHFRPLHVTDFKNRIQILGENKNHFFLCHRPWHYLLMGVSFVCAQEMGCWDWPDGRVPFILTTPDKADSQCQYYIQIIAACSIRNRKSSSPNFYKCWELTFQNFSMLFALRSVSTFEAHHLVLNNSNIGIAFPEVELK